MLKTGLMKLNKSRDFSGKWVRTGLSVAAVCLAIGSPVLAQDSAQQLPSGFAQDQIPNAFGDPSGDPQAQAVSTTTTTTTTQQTTEQQAAQQNAAQVDAATTTTQTTQQQTTTTAVPADQSSMVKQPTDEAVPTQPETRQLVPATPMGTAAQNVEQKQPNATGNTVEDAAEAQFESQQQQQNPVDQYKAAATDQADAEAPDANGDALPDVNNLTMVTLEGDFAGASTKRSKVAVDGSLDAASNAQLQSEIRQEAFDAAITGMFPLSPDQIQGLMKKYDETQRAAQKPPYGDPKPEISVQTMSLDPGVAPPVIKTAVGNVTTLNILDATGAPWPVQDVTWAGDFEIVEPEEGGHIIRITPMGHFARGNMVIRMLTLKTPLTVTLETSRDIVQYRVDARIPEYGPFATTPLMQGGKTLVAGDAVLTGLLDGVAPNGMTKLSVAGVDGRTTAYQMSGTTYVRTPLTLLSPAWQSSVSSADGMNVYALSAAPVLLLSDGGEFARATLKEKEDLLDE